MAAFLCVILCLTPTSWLGLAYSLMETDSQQVREAMANPSLPPLPQLAGRAWLHETKADFSLAVLSQIQKVIFKLAYQRLLVSLSPD